MHWYANTCPSQLPTLSTWIQKTRKGPHSKVKWQKIEGERCSFTLPHRRGTVGTTLSFLLCYDGFHFIWSCSLHAPRVLYKIPKRGFGHLVPQDLRFLLIIHSSSIMAHQIKDFLKECQLSIGQCYWLCSNLLTNLLKTVLRKMYF